MKQFTFLSIIFLFLFFSCNTNKPTESESSFIKNSLSPNLESGIPWITPDCSSGTECYTYAVINALQSQASYDDLLTNTCLTVLDPMMDDLGYDEMPDMYFTFSTNTSNIQAGDVVEYNNGNHVAYAISRYQVRDRNREGYENQESPASPINLGGSYTLTGMWRINSNINFPIPELPNPPSIEFSVYNNRPKIHWDAVPNTVSYKIYRKNGASGSWQPVASTTSLSAVDEDGVYITKPNNNYIQKVCYYKGYAINSTGTSPSSNILSRYLWGAGYTKSILVLNTKIIEEYCIKLNLN